MSAPRTHWLDRLALRSVGRPAAEPRIERAPGIVAESEDEALMTRATVVKAGGVALAAAMLPLGAGTASAGTGRDCYQPCLGITSERYKRDMKQCELRPADFIGPLASGVQRSIWCAIRQTESLANAHDECAKPGCGNLGNKIRNGGDLGSVPVPPLDLPAGTESECENCNTAGGYCGVCPTGTVSKDQQFFCGTPGVQPCRYCNGC